MLTPEARDDLWKRIVAYDGSGGAINAILASAFYLTNTTPVVESGVVVFPGQAAKYDEYPGQLRCYTRGEHHGWLQSPRYMSSLDDACDLVVSALGDGWIVETMIRPDGSQARLHECEPPCRKTVWLGGGPGTKGAAVAIVKAVLQATDPTFKG